jgi:hypothetical protein
MKHELVLLAGKIDWTGSTARSLRSTARMAGLGRHSAVRSRSPYIDS